MGGERVSRDQRKYRIKGDKVTAVCLQRGSAGTGDVDKSDDIGLGGGENIVLTGRRRQFA